MKLVLMRFLLLLTLCYFCDCIFFGKVTKTVKKLFTKRKKIPKEGEFNRDNELEYPGQNKNLLKEIRQLWDNYYHCLDETERGIGLHKSIMPEAKMVFEGSSIRFDCKVCISPIEEENTGEVVWLYKTHMMKSSKMIEYDDNTLISPEDKMLHKYNVKLEDSGQYLCKMGASVTASYFLEVVSEKEPVVMVKPTTARDFTYHPAPKIIFPRYNLEVFSQWEPWSPCTQCNIVGKRTRVGICTVRITGIYTFDDLSGNNLDIMNDTSTPSDSDTGAENSTQLTENTPLQDKAAGRVDIDSKILQLFKKGIPCRSDLLPEQIRSIPEIKNRPTEIAVGFCKVRCPLSEIFEVRDKKGNVIEVTNNTAGIYSSLQGVPTVPPPVQRTSIFGDTAMKEIVLKCPGNINSDVPVLWQIGSKHVGSLALLQQSGGRVYINLLNQMIIKTPVVTDSNIYSCWQMKELVGTIRVDIMEKVQINFSHPIALFGIIMIFGTFLLVFFRAFTKRQR